nr:MAG TPA: hypothetical protein [Caudoviricetes sp.]
MNCEPGKKHSAESVTFAPVQSNQNNEATLNDAESETVCAHHATSLPLVSSAVAKVLTGSPPDNCCAATNAARLMSSPSSHLAMVMRLRLLASAMLVILVLDSSTRLRVSWVARFATSIAGRLDMCNFFRRGGENERCGVSV